MRDLLSACVELDTLAVEVYSLFAETTENDGLRAVFRELQSEESQHLTWWADVRRRLDAGDVFAIAAGTHVTAYMKAIVATMRAMLSGSSVSLSDDDMLALAASLEFFALDPVFGQLIQQSDAEDGSDRLVAYDGHIDRLVTTMEARGSWTLAPHIALLKASEGASPSSHTEDLHDPVTGLPRRLIAEQAMAQLCGDTSRDGEPISLAFLELALGPLYQWDPVLAERELLHIVSAMTSLLKFTDLLARIDTHRYAVVMPATAGGTAVATMSAIADAVSAIASAAADGKQSKWATTAVVTLPAGYRCDADFAFGAAEELLGELHSSGKSVGARQLD